MTKNKGRETEARGPPYLGFQRIQCKAADGSILVVRIFGGLMNLDAFFAFSAMRVRFVQVDGRAFLMTRQTGVYGSLIDRHFAGAAARVRGAARPAYGAVQHPPDAHTTRGARV
ncbi:hypothetical protein [Burkholderia sp. Bp8998]|uniref:hypothetical protein n=1 Tax=Burkholderia sp. Bp8998 TaxID=2184557 RepID=UPI00163B6087|nr:hypothetical protein [Burkholderia sp. Bp8998]